jgi:hypothetical protein
MVRDIQTLEDDIGLAKRIIETVLYNDPDIVELIDNPKISPDTPEELMWENLFPVIRIPGTQDESKSYICYEVDDMSDLSRNDRMKQQIIQFVVFVHKGLIETKYGAPRHDMFGYVIRDLFNRSHLFGHELKLISNRGGTTDTDYYTRTLKFQLITPEVAQDGLFDNRYERLSLNKQNRKIVRENVQNQ